jgi:hypothetical protein
MSLINDSRLSRLNLVGVTGVLVISVSVLMLFQNCSQTPSGDGLTTEEKAAAQMDFSYDTTLDQIAYMSCAMMGTTSYDQSAYFSFRAGAYRTAGIKLSDAFISQNASKSASWQSETLSLSASNTNTVLQLALRSKANLQAIEMSPTSGSPVLGADFSNMFEQLGTTDLNTYFLQQNASRVRYTRDGTPTGGRVEASLYFLNNPDLAEDLRTNLINNDLFTVTYSDMQNQGTQSSARSPASVIPTLPTPAAGATPYPTLNQNPMTFVYGKGYQLTFTYPGQMTKSAFKNDVLLIGVSERNLDSMNDNSNISGWTCPLNLQFKIVRMEDAALQGCDIGPDPAFQGPTDPLWLARNSLRGEDWYIDLAHNCIVPKNAGAGYGCYGPQPSVDYTLSDSTNWEQYPLSNTPVNPLPVAYASICIRNN